MIKLLTVLFLFVFWIGSTFAKKNENWDRGEWKERIKQELNLTEEQVTKMDGIHSKYHSEIQDLRTKSKTLGKELREMAKKPDVTESTLKEKHIELQGVRQELEEKRFSMMLEARGVLKSDQVAGLDKIYKYKHPHKKKAKRQAQEEY